MLNVTQAYKDLIAARTRSDDLVIRITLPGESAFEIGTNAIKGNSVSLVSDCVTGEDLMFGAAIMKMLTVEIETDAQSVGEEYYGATIEPTYIIGSEEVPLGIFTVAEARESGAGNASLVAYDALYALRKEIDLTEPISGYPFDVLSAICQAAGAELGITEETVRDMPNGSMTVVVDSTSGATTCQDCISLVCQHLAGFACADVSGKITVKQFGTSPVRDVLPGNRYSCVPANYTVTYKAIDVYSASGKSTATSDRTSGLTMVIPDAPTWDHASDAGGARQALTQGLLNALLPISYVPGTITMPGDPALECGDMVCIGDSNILITSIAWRFRGIMDIKSVGSNPELNPTTGMSKKKMMRGRTAKIESDLEGISFEYGQKFVESDGKYTELKNQLDMSADGFSNKVMETVTQNGITTTRFSDLENTASGLSLSVGSVTERVDGVEESVESISRLFVVDDTGINLTNPGTGMAVRVDVDEIGFPNGGNPSSTVIRQDEMETTNLRVGVRLDVGGFALIPRSNGNLSLRYVGGS